MSAKYSNYINFNSPNNAGVNGSNRKKMFSSKNHQIQQQNDKAFSTLTLKRQEEPHTATGTGLNGIKNKIDNLENRLNEIKRNYDISSQNRKNGSNNSTNPQNHDRSLRLKDENRNSNKINKNNKENETPKEKKHASSSNNSKLLLDRYNTNNKRLSKGNVTSASTMNLNNVHPRSKDMEGRPPLSPNSPKNAIMAIRQNTFQGSQI